MDNKFRKKPVVIEAFQMTRNRRINNSDWPQWLNDAWNREKNDYNFVFPENSPESDGKDRLIINTLEGEMIVEFDDWIIKGVNDELYPCKPDIFKKTYEKVAIDEKTS